MRMVHVASSQRSCRDEVDDGRVDVIGCIRFFYSNFTVFFVLCHKSSLVISFSINMTPWAGGEASNLAILLSPPSYSSFLRGVGVLHSVRERRESERSLQSFKE
jgi:hypothetical protein